MDNDHCFACMEPLTSGLWSTCCGHVAHEACLNNWFRTYNKDRNKTTASCPICRQMTKAHVLHFVVPDLHLESNDENDPIALKLRLREAEKRLGGSQSDVAALRLEAAKSKDTVDQLRCGWGNLIHRAQAFETEKELALAKSNVRSLQKVHQIINQKVDDLDYSAFSSAVNDRSSRLGVFVDYRDLKQTVANQNDTIHRLTIEMQNLKSKSDDVRLRPAPPKKRPFEFASYTSSAKQTKPAAFPLPKRSRTLIEGLDDDCDVDSVSNSFSH